MATHNGEDVVSVDYNDSARALRFVREAEELPVHDMARLVDTSVTIPVAAFAKGVASDPPKAQARQDLEAPLHLILLVPAAKIVSALL